jgi:hypothetical protein
LEVAELIAAEMRLASSAAIFIDCNAVSPQTMGEVAQHSTTPMRVSWIVALAQLWRLKCAARASTKAYSV